jgi:hypothetical protein
MGWLELARRTNMADRFAEAIPANPAGAASVQSAERAVRGAARNADLDEDENQLAAYNDYLARINGQSVSSRKDDEPTALG